MFGFGGFVDGIRAAGINVGGPVGVVPLVVPAIVTSPLSELNATEISKIPPSAVEGKFKMLEIRPTDFVQALLAESQDQKCRSTSFENTRRELCFEFGSTDVAVPVNRRVLGLRRIDQVSGPQTRPKAHLRHRRISLSTLRPTSESLQLSISHLNSETWPRAR